MDEKPRPGQFSLLRVLAAMPIFAIAGAVVGIGQSELVASFIAGGIALLFGLQHGVGITAAWIALILVTSLLIS